MSRTVRAAWWHDRPPDVCDNGRRRVARQAADGDTLMVALLTGMRTLRDSEFGDGRRAGFCLMGACQDCWVWTADGDRLRACTTPAVAGMSIVTQLAAAGEGIWRCVIVISTGPAGVRAAEALVEAGLRRPGDR